MFFPFSAFPVPFATKRTTPKLSSWKQQFSLMILHNWVFLLFLSKVTCLLAAAAQLRWPGQLVSVSPRSLSSWTSSHHGGLRVPRGQAPLHKFLSRSLSLMAFLLTSHWPKPFKPGVGVARDYIQGCGYQKVWLIQSLYWYNLPHLLSGLFVWLWFLLFPHHFSERIFFLW